MTIAQLVTRASVSFKWVRQTVACLAIRAKLGNKCVTLLLCVLQELQQPQLPPQLLPLSHPLHLQRQLQLQSRQLALLCQFARRLPLSRALHKHPRPLQHRLWSATATQPPQSPTSVAPVGWSTQPASTALCRPPWAPALPWQAPTAPSAAASCWPTMPTRLWSAIPAPRSVRLPQLPALRWLQPQRQLRPQAQQASPNSCMWPASLKCAGWLLWACLPATKQEWRCCLLLLLGTRHLCLDRIP